jgi:hypothetical protein
MGTRGGSRPNSGRKPKALELSLIDSMDAYMAPNEFWAAVAAKCEAGDTQALKLWASYRFGMPKQVIDQNVNMIEPIVIDWKGKQNES